jgi:hypothetical protein
MKIQTDSNHINFEAETNLDIFFLGQLHQELLISKINKVITLISPNEETKTGRLSVQKSDFISYLFNKISKPCN